MGEGVILTVHDNHDTPAHQIEAHANIEEAQRAVSSLIFKWVEPVVAENIFGVTLLIGKN